MLSELKVSQFAIIDKVHIHFNDGLNILSGETGAGKSILIKSLALLMGAKSSSQDIRSNKDRATIEGAFDLNKRQDIVDKLEEMGIESEDLGLIVRRQIQRNGKSKVYLNGHLSSVADLRRIVFPLVTMSNPTEAPLVEITGQHENKDLMSGRYQLDVLDQFCGNLKLRGEAKALFDEMKSIASRMEELEQRSQQREQQIDFLDYQISEIENIGLAENEDDELKLQIHGLKNKRQWQEWIQNSVDRLVNIEPSVLASIKKIIDQAPAEQELKTTTQQLEQAYSLLEDVAYQLQNKMNQDENIDSELENKEERLSRIRKLQKKFGDSIEEIFVSLAHMKKEHHELTNLSQTLHNLSDEYRQREEEFLSICKKLNKKRSNGAKLLSKEVNNELKDLNMKGLKFLISVEMTTETQSTGADHVRFQTQTGSGDEARDLSHAASGGELSRILLSLKQVIGANQHPRTFLFDEVDTGVSGPTAEKVGAKLKNLAQHQQVICVTHLPQVASFGDFHYFIEKQPIKDSVEMSVKLLKKSERVEEIARLISGEKLTKTSRAHAKQLLSLSS